jgi:hypothetical protein
LKQVVDSVVFFLPRHSVCVSTIHETTFNVRQQISYGCN